jgi:5-hydroxyisourate hydrolase-like protein (transthyretin family)
LLKRFAVISALILFLAGAVTPAAAQSAGGTITGFLNNGTANGSSVANVEVKLQTYVNQSLTANATTKTQSDGSFKFGNLTTGAQITYRVAVLNFQEADYYSGNISFAPNETNETQNVTVYDSTDNASVVAVDTVHTIIAAGKDDLEFTVVYDFVNNSDRAYIGAGDSMANGKKKTLTFTIPTEAAQVQYGDGFDANYVYPSHGGFIDTMAVVPGVKEVVYAYAVPYKGGTYKFQAKMNYPTTWFNLLVEGTGLKVKSSQLADQGPLDMGQGFTYTYFTGQNFTAGQTVAATLSGTGLSTQMLLIIVGGAALLILAGGGVAFWRMRGSRQPQPVARRAPAADNEQALLMELAQLDDDFAAGRIPEDAYRAKRAAKKARLVKLMGGSRG